MEGMGERSETGCSHHALSQAEDLLYVGVGLGFCLRLLPICISAAEGGRAGERTSGLPIGILGLCAGSLPHHVAVVHATQMIAFIRRFVLLYNFCRRHPMTRVSSLKAAWQLARGWNEGLPVKAEERSPEFGSRNAPCDRL